MASSLHHIASNFLTGPVVPFRPTVSRRSRFSTTTNFSKNSLSQVSTLVAQRSPKQNNGFRKTTQRWHINKPAICDQSSQSVKLYSGLLKIDVAKLYANFEAPGMEMMEDEECLCILVNMPGLKSEDVKVSVTDNKRVCIEGERPYEVQYLGLVWLPENIDITSSSMKQEMKGGMFKLTFRKLELEEKQLKTSIIDNVITYLNNKLPFSWPSFTDIVFSAFWTYAEYCCLADDHKFSITVYKKETAESVQVRFMYDLHEMEFSKEGGCVSVNMPELKIEDVKTYFKYGSLEIEGKTNKVHYVTCISLPKSILKKRDMIKTEMQHGVYKATLPYAY